ncbi:sigma factor-like helix-turn-helix DNA-binding protein [Armatimonas sp.]|uniref:sigma factor-like helix-turn-helix DNA-binding protein n=1 Tax=Armatimonas sp. TaxID=1872638 RepID=UPI003750FD7E
MYLGLDLAAKKANWALWSEGKLVEEGEVTTVAFPKLLERLKPVACAMEWTGRLAIQWALMVEEHGTEAFIIHTNQRAAMCRLAGQSHKDDRADAQGIARYLFLWHDEYRRASLGLISSLFVPWPSIAQAWELRGLVADSETLKKLRVSAKLRVGAAERAGQTDRKKPWEDAAKSTGPEDAFALAVSFAQAQFPAEWELLLGVPHVGESLAVRLLAVLLPISRFEEEVEGQDKTIENVRKYLRWSPRREQTGTTTNRTVRAKLPSHPVVGSLYLAGMVAASYPDLSKFGRQITARKARGITPGKAVRRTADSLLRCCVAILRSGEPYHDPDQAERVVELSREQRRPGHLVTQAEAARLMGVSRERVRQLVNAGTLRAEEHEGKWHPILKYVELWESAKPKKKPPEEAEPGE